MAVYEKRSPIPAPVEDLFSYHENPGAFMRLNPPWEPVELIDYSGSIQEGSTAHIKLKIGPIPVHWKLVHRDFRKNEQFADAQITGPFARWIHTHYMEADPAGSAIRDHIDYKLPMGILGQIFGGAFARAKMERMFRYRHTTTANDLAAHQTYKSSPRLTIAITGASGLVGSQLTPFLTTGGHTVREITRSHKANTIHWNPETGELDPKQLEGVDVVVHLAGENIGGKRWSAAQKKRILDSRVKGTRLLAETLAAMPAETRPKTLITSSAIGYYGDRGAEILTENSPSGDDFLADVCRQWEGATALAAEAGIRVVTLRSGIVMAMNGGSLGQMLLPFLMGVGGVLGNGEQYFSWIALDDIIGVIHHTIMNPDMFGIYNASSPNPVTNREFTKTLGRVLRRPTLIPVPTFGLRRLFGEMADGLLLSSARVMPERLTNAGYQFRYPQLEAALRHVLGR
jgi:uncharacterized protein